MSHPDSVLTVIENSTEKQYCGVSDKVSSLGKIMELTFSLKPLKIILVHTKSKLIFFVSV